MWCPATAPVETGAGCSVRNEAGGRRRWRPVASEHERRLGEYERQVGDLQQQLKALREEVVKLTMPPSAYGTFVSANDDGTVDVFTAGRKMRVALHPELELDTLEAGQEVVLNESLNVVLARGPEASGEVVTIKELLADGTRALVVGRADEERVAELATSLIGERLRAGDHLLLDGRSGLLVER